MKRLFLQSVFAWMITVSSVASAQDKDFFPVMAWNSPPADPAVLKKMKECGLTVAGFVPPGGLDAVHAAGLKAIVSDPRVSDHSWQNVDEPAARTRVTALISEVGNHPAVFGYYLRDEPPAAFFPGLAKVASLVRELAPGKWAYINLFPNYATSDQLGASTYEEYIEKFVAACHPTTLSYDHYALMDNGTLRASYWKNLEQMRAASLKHSIPFWNIVLTVAHFDYREPSAADLRFQVYSTLAYGGRGISYFTYFAPQVGNYRMAPIDQFGNPTATWAHLQNVNHQIAKLAPTLLHITSNEVYHFGAVPEGCSAPKDNTLVRGIAGDFAVGDFTHEDGSRYVLLVNKNLEKSIPVSPQFRQSPKKIELVSPYTGLLTAFEGEQVWVAPGQGALLKLSF